MTKTETKPKTKVPKVPKHRPWRIVVANVAGGEGKTTLARELAYILHQRGQRVALFDLDPQASLSISLGHAFTPYPTVLPIYQGEELTPLPAPLDVDGFSFWAANDTLSGVEALLYDFTKITRLREAVDQLQETNPYDVIIFDTKPQKTNFLASCFAAGDHVIVPVSHLKGVENFRGIGSLIQSVKPFSPNLKLRMIVPMQHQRNVRHHRKLLEYIKEKYGDMAAISSPMRYSPAVIGDALELGSTPTLVSPDADVVKDLNVIVDEVIDVLKET